LAVVGIGLDSGEEDQGVAFDPSSAALVLADRTLVGSGDPDQAGRCSSAEMDRESMKSESAVVSFDSKGTLVVADPY
jgi:hypothetical protein